MKTLYVSDLDGTLLRSDQKTSAYTNRTINRLVEQGMLFSYATARSYNTAHKVTAGMTAAFPLIVYNGAFIKDNATGEMLLENFFDQPDATKLIRELIAAGIRPIVYGFVEGEEKFSYLADEINQPTRDFVLSRAGDSRDRPIAGGGLAALLEGDIFYITCIDSPEKLGPFHEKYKDRYHCVYQRDIYSGDQWLEIMPLEASKSRAIVQLKKQLGCDRLIVFGDAINDLDMFQIADEAYAVENACPELKEAATAIIAANDEDGVARWLESHIDID
ncbi:MAG: HAD family hydrolase [Firmicutes bacterium]|nr:HAD family hydrolase [Bacillota bacterium]